MKFIVLSGFLGSGKTSLLMPLARDIVNSCEGGDKTKLVIIENEIGTVGVDNVYADGAGYSSKELFNGCVCCSIIGDLMECLADLEANENPEWVILETTGLARPADIAMNLWTYYDEDMNITTCVVIDSSRWKKLSQNEEISELVYDQISDANYVLLNKVDLVDEDTVNFIKKDIEGKTEGKLYEMSATADVEGMHRVNNEIIQEILSWE